MTTAEKKREGIGSPRRHPSDEEEALLLQDDRWLLVQRILDSPGFQRADQLRKILIYISRRALLQPSDSIREYEIACDVLGRRSDFDSGSDTIVRVQISHLRRKLDLYFTVEAPKETLRLTIPRGSYAASFEQRSPDPFNSPAHEEVQIDSHAVPPDSNMPSSDGTLIVTPVVEASPHARSNRRSWWWVAFACLCTSLLTATLDFALRGKRPSPAQGRTQVEAVNPFLRPLLADRKSITVVLPDTSIMIIQTLLGQDLSAASYVTGSAQEDIKGVKDPGLKLALSYIADRRNTSFNEAAAVVELTNHLSLAGAASTVRYARDLHVNDIDGDVILIGSRRSNPWATLFSDKINFRLLPDSTSHEFAFVNAHPLPGEAPEYAPDFTHFERVVLYADIALVPNLNNTGAVLLISGSDVQGTEAAVRFMLEGNWPPQLQALFARKDLKSYEVFLRGTHIKNEAPDHFDVIAIR